MYDYLPVVEAVDVAGGDVDGEVLVEEEELHWSYELYVRVGIARPSVFPLDQKHRCVKIYI